MKSRLIGVLATVLIVPAAAACGSSSSSSSHSGSAPAAKTSSTAPASQVGALSGEAASAATGDIPDTQVFLTFHDPAARYSISYPEGWARKGTGTNTTFADKNNIVRIVVATGPPPTPASVAGELAGLKKSNPTLTFTAPTVVQLKSGPAVKARYTTRSAPNPVTGKSVLLVVDRYELGHAGKRATIDLGTARGVDNVDAYRMISDSFRWQ